MFQNLFSQFPGTPNLNGALLAALQFCGALTRTFKMAKQARTEAATHHETAAKHHRAAADMHEKGDKSASEHSTKAHALSKTAHESSEKAHSKSSAK